MHPQLTSVIQELDAARSRLHALAATVEDADWNRRPDTNRWSVAECVAHLNLTGEAFLPLIDEALGRAYARGGGVRRRLRRSIAGWLLWRLMAPPPRFRAKTTARFLPTGDLTRARLIERFDALHEELIGRIHRADGYPIDRVRLVSPFDRRAKYDVYGALTIIARHEHRHLWQAEQVRDELRSSKAGATASRTPVAR